MARLQLNADTARLALQAFKAVLSAEGQHALMPLERRSLDAIAADKIDITAPGGGVVTGWLPDGVGDFCRGHAAKSGRWLVDVTGGTEIEFGRGSEISVTTAVGAESLVMKWQPATPVDYLARNAVLGLHATARLNLKNVTPGDLADAFSAAIHETRLIGRFEKLSEAPLVICDFAHTPAAARAVVATTDRLYAGRRIVGVVGISHDKNHTDMLREFTGSWKAFLGFSARHKGRDAVTLEHEMRHAAFTQMLTHGHTGLTSSDDERIDLF